MDIITLQLILYYGKVCQKLLIALEQFGEVIHIAIELFPV